MKRIERKKITTMGSLLLSGCLITSAWTGAAEVDNPEEAAIAEADSSSSDETAVAYGRYIRDEVLSVMGYADLAETAEVISADTEGTANKEERSGLLGADIVDLDGDGQEELLLYYFASGKNTDGAVEIEGSGKIYADLYTQNEEGAVEFAGSQYLCDNAGAGFDCVHAGLMTVEGASYLYVEWFEEKYYSEEDNSGYQWFSYVDGEFLPVWTLAQAGDDQSGISYSLLTRKEDGGYDEAVLWADATYREQNMDVFVYTMQDSPVEDAVQMGLQILGLPEAGTGIEGYSREAMPTYQEDANFQEAFAYHSMGEEEGQDGSRRIVVTVEDNTGIQERVENLGEAEAKLESEAELETEVETETDVESEVETEIDAESETEIETEAETEADVESEAETETETEIDEESEAETESEVELESETELETEAETETDVENEAETEAEAETELESETELETEAETEIDVESEAETEAEVETELEAEAETEIDVESEMETEAEVETELETEAETEIDVESETEIETEIETEGETEEARSIFWFGNEFETESESETELETEGETEIDEESETEIETEAETEMEGETEEAGSIFGFGSELETESESETEIETEAETEIDVESESETESKHRPVLEPEPIPETEAELQTELQTETETETEEETEEETEVMTASETEFEGKTEAESETESEALTTVHAELPAKLYYASTQDNDGQVKLSVAVDEEENILEITVLECEGGEENQQAAEEMAAQIVASQSTDIEAADDAAQTADAVLCSVKAVLVAIQAEKQAEETKMSEEQATEAPVEETEAAAAAEAGETTPETPAAETETFAAEVPAAETETSAAEAPAETETSAAETETSSGGTVQQETEGRNGLETGEALFPITKEESFWPEEDSSTGESQSSTEASQQQTEFAITTEDSYHLDTSAATAGAVSGDTSFYVDGTPVAQNQYILPESSTRYLTSDDLSRLTMKGVSYAKNEIYAKHGRKFIAQELQTYFGKQSWYRGSIEAADFTEAQVNALFNEYEKSNVAFMSQWEATHGEYQY